MAVPVYRRNASDMKFISNFAKLRKECINLAVRDFGVKAKVYDVHLIEQIYDINEIDKQALENIMTKYNIAGIEVDKIPEWLVNTWRYEVLCIINNIGVNIRCANSIYISNIQEYYNKRNRWNDAIGYCYALEDKLQEIIDCVRNIKLGSYEEIFELITEEVKLLKGVRRADNKCLKGLNNQLPYFNDGFVYNNYAGIPLAPNYYLNRNSVEHVQHRPEDVTDNVIPFKPQDQEETG